MLYVIVEKDLSHVIIKREASYAKMKETNSCGDLQSHILT